MRIKKEFFELPCGYPSAESGIIYSHVETRMMTGVEEDILSDEAKQQDQKNIDEVIMSCCKLSSDPEKEKKPALLEITPEILNNMYLGDKMACLLAIRRVSYGDDYEFGIECPTCRRESRYKFSLKSLPTKKMKDPAQAEIDIKLPQAGNTLTFSAMTGKQEKMLKRMQRDNPNKQSTANLACRLLSADGKKIGNPIAFLQPLGSYDRAYCRNILDKFDGGIDLELKLSCKNKNCPQPKIETILPFQTNFFSPTFD